MNARSWVLYLGLMVAAAAFVLWLYRRREPPGRGRLLLAALRFSAIGIVLLLVLDPSLPDRRRTGRSRTFVLLDASASMSLPARTGGPSRWTTAVREARRRGERVLLFGASARPAALDSLPAEPPGDVRSLLLPALAAAAEAGAERVTVLTDAALEDADLLPGWLARLGLRVEWQRIGAPVPGLALTGVAAPGWARAGQPVELDVTVLATGTRRDSARLVVRQDGRVLAEGTVAPPPSGRSVSARLVLHPVAPPSPGYVRLDVALEPGDAVPDDDRRAVSLFVSPDPAGVAVVSLQPDQEPRFLLPVLQRSLGLPARGFLRAGSDWVRVAEGEEAGERLAEGDVARTVAGADLVVIHGAGAAPPPWVLQTLRASPRLIVLPGSAPTAGLPLPVELGEPVAADWFVAQALPASPVAALLGDVPVAELAPLPTVRPAVPPAGAWSPLTVTRGRGGEPSPLVLAGEAGGRRWAVALADGYWRWAFRGGDGRQLYDRLWASLGGWLLREQAAGAAGVRPQQRVLPRGELPVWLTPGIRPDSLRLRVARADGTVLDTVLSAAPDDTLRGPALPPGAYRYAAAAFGTAGEAAGEGDLYVEAYTPEFSRPLVPLPDIAPASTVGGADAREGRAERPLHTTPLPYILAVLLLAAEWLLRRRWGLR